METLGDRIKNIRGMTSQAQFASGLGITQTKLSRYERNTTPPEIDFLVRLSRQYAVSLDWLLTGNKSSPSPQPNDVADAFATGEVKSQSILDSQYVTTLATLESELAAERIERRELAAENRQLHKENAALLREIVELREKIARLEERKNRLAVATDQPVQSSGVA